MRNDPIDVASTTRSGAACAQCGWRAWFAPATLDWHELIEIQNAVEHRHGVRRGQHLFRAGDPLQMIYVLTSGSLKTSINDRDGRVQVTGFSMPGELVGIEAIASGSYPCNVMAIEDSRCCGIRYSDLERLPFTRAAVDETLRLYPPGWLLTRRAIAADSIGGITLPAGADVLISPYLVHRHPALWADPERFDPGRFGGGDGDTDRRIRFAYLPFGLGARACIGEHLALVEMHTHVATLARRFDLELVPGQSVEREPQVNLRTRHPLRMIPRLRHPSPREP